MLIGKPVVDLIPISVN